MKMTCAIGAILASALSAPPAAWAEESTAGAAAPSVEVQREVERRTVELTTDTALALESTAPFAELSIANPAIADISTISTNSVYVLGKKPGRTTLMLLGEGGHVMSIIDVRVTPDISEFRARLAEILPGEEIEAFTANDGIVLTGRVSGQSQVDRAVALAGHYAPGRVSNLMTIEAPRVAAASAPAPAAAPEAVVPDVAAVERNLAEILPGENIEVHALGETLVLSGRATSPEAASQAVEVATLASGGAKISNLITVEATRDCSVRTRRGGEMIETTIPCRDEAARAADTAPAVAALDTAVAGAELTRPKPRPARVVLN
jgi:Flp pilus assembly secretin CpaC